MLVWLIVWSNGLIVEQRQSLTDHHFSSSVIGQFIYENMYERRSVGSHFVSVAHLKADLWLVRWYKNKHGGRNKSNKAFENKCYLLYGIIK